MRPGKLRRRVRQSRRHVLSLTSRRRAARFKKRRTVYRNEERQRQEQQSWEEYRADAGAFGVGIGTAAPEIFGQDGSKEEEKTEEQAPQEQRIDNSAFSFTAGRNPVCIRLDDRKRDRLRTSETLLQKRFPREMERLGETDRLERILSEVFPDGFQKNLYVRNLSFDNDGSSEVRVLGLRPEIYPGDFLSELLPEGVSLLFKGHIRGKEFLVDSVFDVADTGRLDYEAACTVVQYSAPERVGKNIFYDVAAQTQSLARYTAENLTEWKAYLDWKQELARRQIYGCKYFRITVDEKRRHLVFWLICENEEYFQAFRKHLNRDIQAFNNDYSSDEWVFQLAQEDNRGRRRRYYQGMGLGRYRGIVRAYYLTGKKSNQEGEVSEQEAQGEADAEYDDEDSILDAVRMRFAHPYVAQVAFEIPQESVNEILARDLQGEEMVQYILDRVLPSYEPTGFLALSAVGTFVLINRFRRAISQMERDESYSPNLAAWLFNVRQVGS